MAELKKSLGLLQLLAFGIAGVVGSSWIYTNSLLFDSYGAGGVVLGLAIGVLLATCVALAYSELTSAFPRAGGEVVFSYTALGRRASFFTGWMLLGAYVSSLAFYVTAFGYLLGNFFPVFNTIPLYTINGETVYLPVLLVGVALTLLFLVLNWYGIEVGAQVQLAMFAAIVIIGAALAVTGFSAGSADNFLPAYHPGSNALADTLRFVIPSMTFLAGFGLVSVLAEDAKIPARRIGRAVVITVLAAGGFYCLVLAATAWVFPWEETAAMPLGTVSAFQAAGFPVLAVGAYLIAFLGLLTSFLGLFVASSRVLVAMGRARLLPEGLSAVHPRRRTPHVALLFTAAVTLGLGWLGPGAVVWFLDTGGVYLGLVWFMVVLSKYLLPRRYPGLERPYVSRLWFLPAIGALGAVAVIVWALVPNSGASLVWPAEYIILGVWLVLGLLLYLVARPRTRTDALQSLLGDSYSMLERGSLR
ncbi:MULTISPECIES: APC family permease [Brevibacterium]|uniref:Amino acid permease n=1 Tax=Brevibacterium salitolerans TaxID=1403566 RepID=A0ABN2WLU1_9MICO|nr:APC family permease [Brevibacterium sp.]